MRNLPRKGAERANGDPLSWSSRLNTSVYACYRWESMA